MSAPDLTVEFGFRRSFGRHDFTTAGGDSVTVIAEPTWEEFWDTTSTSADLGRIVLSPELMTSPLPIDQIAGSKHLIGERIAQVRELSRSHAETTFALGTAAFNNQTGRPANSILLVKDGSVVGQNNKAWSLSSQEKSLFTFKAVHGPSRIAPHIATLVCSDIFGETSTQRHPVYVGNRVATYRNTLLRGSDNQNPANKVGSQTETVLLSSCWAVPLMTNLSQGESPVAKDDWYRRQLESRLAMLFSLNPGLLDIIIADRSTGVSGDVLPFVGQFRR
jgi:hypothetical protein